jgi:hypothetical protein
MGNAQAEPPGEVRTHAEINSYTTPLAVTGPYRSMRLCVGKTGFLSTRVSVHSPRTMNHALPRLAARALTSEGSRPCATAPLLSFPGHGTR